jgi:hypothetical protein
LKKNLCGIFARATKRPVITLKHVVKVISRFEFFLLTLGHGLVIGLKVVVMNSELNSASNGVLSKGGCGPCLWTLGENTG